MHSNQSTGQSTSKFQKNLLTLFNNTNQQNTPELTTFSRYYDQLHMLSQNSTKLISTLRSIGPLPEYVPLSSDDFNNNTISTTKTDKVDQVDRDKHLPESDKHLSESDKHLPESDKHLSESDKHLSESDKHLSESDKHLPESDKHLSESDKHLPESDKHLSQFDKELCELIAKKRSELNELINNNKKRKIEDVRVNQNKIAISKNCHLCDGGISEEQNKCPHCQSDLFRKNKTFNEINLRYIKEIIGVNYAKNNVNIVEKIMKKLHDNGNDLTMFYMLIIKNNIIHMNDINEFLLNIQPFLSQISNFVDKCKIFKYLTKFCDNNKLKILVELLTLLLRDFVLYKERKTDNNCYDVLLLNSQILYFKNIRKLIKTSIKYNKNISLDVLVKIFEVFQSDSYYTCQLVYYNNETPVKILIKYTPVMMVMKYCFKYGSVSLIKSMIKSWKCYKINIECINYIRKNYYIEIFVYDLDIIYNKSRANTVDNILPYMDNIYANIFKSKEIILKNPDLRMATKGTFHGFQVSIAMSCIRFYNTLILFRDVILEYAKYNMKFMGFVVKCLLVINQISYLGRYKTQYIPSCINVDFCYNIMKHIEIEAYDELFHRRILFTDIIRNMYVYVKMIIYSNKNNNFVIEKKIWESLEGYIYSSRGSINSRRISSNDIRVDYKFWKFIIHKSLKIQDIMQMGIDLIHVYRKYCLRYYKIDNLIINELNIALRNKDKFLIAALTE